MLSKELCIFYLFIYLFLLLLFLFVFCLFVFVCFLKGVYSEKQTNATPHFSEVASSVEKQTGSHKSCVPYKMAEKCNLDE